jgi:hypothetical protein
MPDPVVTPAATPAAEPAKVEAPAKTASEKLHERVAEAMAKADAEETAPPAPVAATVEMDAKTLDKLTQASERARLATKRADAEQKKREDIEASQVDVAPMREAMKLWKDGKKVEAVAKLSSVEDPSAEIEDLLQKWLAIPAKGEAKLSPAEIAALQADVAAVKKAEEARAAVEKLAADRRNAESFSAQLRDAKGDDGAPKYPFASKPENAPEAAVVALEKANALLLKLGSPSVTRELAQHLFDLAYAEIEANLTKAQPAPVVAARPAARAATIPRAGATPATKKDYPRTPEGAREALLDRARAVVEKSGGTWS